MKVGDLVKYRAGGVGIALGIIVRFDSDGDPVVHQTHNGVITVLWRRSIEVLNESR